MTKTHPIPAAALKQSIAIVGRVGSGKTYAAKGAVEILLREGSRVCILDPTGVWNGLRSSADGKEPGFPVVVFGGAHADVPIADTSGHALAHVLATQNLPAIVDVSEFSSRGTVRFATAFLDELYRLNRKPLTLVVDEADVFAPQRVQPDETTMLSRMEQIARRGRVRGFRVWLISQRPAVLAKSVLSQANTLIAMQLTAPQDRDAIGAWIEGQADREQGKRILADLPKMARGEGYVWAPGENILERVTFPAITTYDSSRTPEDGEELEPTAIAQVDLSAIGETLRAAEEEQSSNDPKALRARIDELESQIYSQETGATETPEDCFARGYVAGSNAAKADAKAFFAAVIGRIRSAVATGEFEISTESALLQDTDEKVVDAEYREVGERPTPVTEDSEIFEARMPAAGDDKLSKAERLILTVLAQYPRGRSNVQIALVAGYAHSGGGFRNALGSLRTKGFITGTGELQLATPAGLKALGTFKKLPTGRALLDHWYAQLSKAERKILESLSEVHPRSLTPAQIANRSGYEAGGGGFRNALGRLRTLELIRGRAEIHASPELFS